MPSKKSAQTVTQEFSKTQLIVPKTSSKKTIHDVLGLNGRLLALLPYVIASIIFIVLPTILLLVKATVPAAPGYDNWQLIKEKSTWIVMGRSIWVGLSAAILSLAIAFPFAYFVARSQSKTYRTVAMTLIVSPLFMFTIVKLSGYKGLLIMMFDGPQNINSPFWVILGMVYIYLPFMIIPLYSVLQTMPRSFVEASKDLGYNSVQTIYKVVIPYALKAVFSGLAIVFMLSATSVAISEKIPYMIGDHKMIGNEIYSRATQLSDGFKIAQASSLALITILIMSTTYGLIYLTPQIIRKMRGGVNA